MPSCLILSNGCWFYFVFVLVVVSCNLVLFHVQAIGKLGGDLTLAGKSVLLPVVILIEFGLALVFRITLLQDGGVLPPK